MYFDWLAVKTTPMCTKSAKGPRKVGVVRSTTVSQLRPANSGGSEDHLDGRSVLVKTCGVRNARNVKEPVILLQLASRVQLAVDQSHHNGAAQGS